MHMSGPVQTALRLNACSHSRSLASGALNDMPCGSSNTSRLSVSGQGLSDIPYLISYARPLVRAVVRWGRAPTVPAGATGRVAGYRL